MEIRAGLNSHQPTPRVKPEPNEEKRGAMVIIDSFQSAGSHGHVVEEAARSLGPTGPVYRYHQHQVVNGRPTMPHVQAVKRLTPPMATSLLPAEQATSLLEGFIEDAAAGNLGLGTSILAAVTAEDFENSVVNYSQGLDPITLLQLLKHPLSKGSKLTPQQKDAYYRNLSTAIAPDSPSPLAAKELDNGLLQKIKSTIKESPVIEEAIGEWRNQVLEFESGRNSVVIAAGNSGHAQKALAANGFDIDGTEDLNIFAVPEVTVVGATVETGDGGIALASPSGFGPEVDFIAPGQHGEHFGTSFATPKVANAMRVAHLANSNFSSDEAEEWTRTELSDVGMVNDHTVAILDTRRASSFLKYSG